MQANRGSSSPQVPTLSSIQRPLFASEAEARSVDMPEPEASFVKVRRGSLKKPVEDGAAPGPMTEEDAMHLQSMVSMRLQSVASMPTSPATPPVASAHTSPGKAPSEARGGEPVSSAADTKKKRRLTPLMSIKPNASGLLPGEEAQDEPSPMVTSKHPFQPPQDSPTVDSPKAAPHRSPAKK